MSAAYGSAIRLFAKRCCCSSYATEGLDDEKDERRDPAEKIHKDIKRATRKAYSSEEKIRDRVGWVRGGEDWTCSPRY